MAATPNQKATPKPRRRGAPPKPPGEKYVSINLSVSPHDKQRYMDYCDAAGIPIAELLRNAANIYLAKACDKKT